MAKPIAQPSYAIEYPDEAGHPDGRGTLSQDQAVLVDVVIDDPHAPAFDFYVVNDEKTGVYEAIVGDTVIAGLPCNVVGDDRLVLLATSVVPRTGHRHRADPTCPRRRTHARKEGHHHVSDRAHLYRVQPRVYGPHPPRAPGADRRVAPVLNQPAGLR